MFKTFFAEPHRCNTENKIRKVEFSHKCCCTIWLLEEIKGRAADKHKSFEKQQKKKEKSVQKVNDINDKWKSHLPSQ